MLKLTIEVSAGDLEAFRNWRRTVTWYRSQERQPVAIQLLYSHDEMSGAEALEALERVVFTNEGELRHERK